MKMNNPFDTYSRGLTARERRIRSKWGLLLLVSGIVCIVLAFRSHQQAKRIDAQAKRIDSLVTQLETMHDDLFNESSTNGRYELSLEYLKETNPKAAKDFEDFFEHQTE
jgi:hypothetical protein